MRWLRKSLALALIGLLLSGSPAYATIAFFGVASVPADNGTNTADPEIAPPASMTLHDLVVVNCGAANNAVTVDISATDGGQSWTDLGGDTTNLSSHVLWTSFDGTWDNNPIFDFSATPGNASCVMLVFRPTTTACTWAVDNTLAFVNVSSGSTTHTITGVTRAGASAVAVGGWFVEGAPPATWSNFAWTGGSQTGLGAQYRNTAGVDNSFAYAYHIGTGATGNAALDQSATYNGKTLIVSFAETCPAGGGPARGLLLGVADDD